MANITPAYVLKVAKQMVEENGLINLSRKELCERVGINDGSFSHTVGCSFTEFVNTHLKNIPCTFSGTVIKTRTVPLLRKEHILNTAVELCKKPGGFSKLTRNQIAETAGVSEGLINNYYGTMVQLKRDIMRNAISNEIAEIIGQGLASNDKHAKKAPTYLKMKAANLIANA